MSKREEPGWRAEEIVETLMEMADEGKARGMQRFFKTGHGDYGEGDRFMGVTNGQVRQVVKAAWRGTSLDEAERLVRHEVHEARLCGLLIMVEKYLAAMKAAVRCEKRGQRSDETAEALSEIYERYVRLHTYINNWDLVDLSAIKIVGNHEARQKAGNRERETLMDEWIKEGHTLWQRRISMVSTWMLTRKGMPETALRRAGMLLTSEHDLLHKAAGWMLREMWKQGYEAELRAFLGEHIEPMPSVMLSYACEQMAKEERRHWQQLRRGSR